MLVHDLHVLLAKTRDEEMTKSCGPCVALWLTALGSIGIASTSGSVELQTGQAKFTYLRHGYSRFCLGNTHRGCTVDQLSRLWQRDISA
jgi:hypothetical protein